MDFWKPVDPRCFWVGVLHVLQVHAVFILDVCQRIFDFSYHPVKWCFRNDLVPRTSKGLLTTCDSCIVRFLLQDHNRVPFDGLDSWLKTLKQEKPLAAIYIKVAKLCMEQTQFQFRGAYYQQTFGTAMVNALSPFFANLFMGDMENKLKHRRLFPRDWVRYADDVFAVVCKDGVLYLSALLNSQHESMKFTYEMEKDGKLPFLDVEVGRSDNTGLLLNTQRFIINESHHNVQHKQHSTACFTEQ
jgi:hypothetical protein